MQAIFNLLTCQPCLQRRTGLQLLLIASSSVLVMASGMTGVAAPLPLVASPLRVSQASRSVSEIREAAKVAIAKADQFRDQAAWFEAIQQYKTGLKLLEQISDPTREDRYKIAQTLSWLALTHRSVGQYSQALADGAKARQTYQALNDTISAATSTGLIAGIYGEIGDYPQSLELYQQAIVVYQSAGDQTIFTQARTLSWVGDTYAHLGETQNALAAYQQALSLWKKSGDVSNQADVLETIAGFYTNQGNFNQVWNYLKQAKSVNPSFDLDNSFPYQALQKFYAFTGAAPKATTPYLDLLGDSEQKIKQLTQLLQVSEKQGNLREIYFTLGALASTYNYSRGDYQSALVTYQKALAIAQKSGNRNREADSLLGIAEVLTNSGKKQEALDYNLQALAIQQQFRNRPAEADTLKQIGDLYASLNATDLARKSYLQALELFKKQEHWAGLGATLRQLARLEYDLKSFPQAIAYYQRANQVSRDAGNRGLQISALTGLSRTYAEAQDPELALQTIDAAIQVARDAHFSEYETLALGVKGRVLTQTGNYDQALAISQNTLMMLQKDSKPEAKASVLRNIAEIYQQLKQSPKAMTYYRQSLAIWRDLGNRTEEALTLYQIAKVESQAKDLQKALSDINLAIEIVEQIRSNVASSDLRTSFFAANQNYYKLKIDILMNLHRQNPKAGYDALALNTSESDRARSLLDILNEARIDIRQGVDPQLLEQEQMLQQNINLALKQQLINASATDAKPQAAALKQEIEQLLSRYKEVQAQIRRASPHYAALTQPKPLTLKEIQTQVLDPDSVLLEYSLGETHSYLWVVTPTRLYTLDLPQRDEITTAVKLFRKNLSARTPPAQLNSILGDISQKILKPAALFLQNKRLLIVTDGVLRYVPFAALPNPNAKNVSPTAASSPSPLVVDHEIVHLPSASTLAILRQETAGRKLAPRKIAVFADPVFDAQDARVSPQPGSASPTTAQPIPVSVQLLEPSRGGLQRLPGTRQEAQNILELFSPEERSQAFDFAANRAVALDPKLMQYQILHFATHGILNETNPELSGIALSLIDAQGWPENGFLQLRDIYNLRLPAELVVLSACQTGGGKEIQGEGIIGLTRGFMYAGAKSTVVSLWSVDDQATAELMTQFYQKIRQEHLSPSAALRAAQIKLWQDPQRRSPYYWAAFQLQGDWQWTLEK